MAKRKPQRQKAAEKTAITDESEDDGPPLRIGISGWFGVLLVLMSIVGVCAALNSLCWQLQTRWQYTEGVCRVVTAEIVHFNNSYELNIEHQVEVNGRKYRPTRNTEQHNPSYNNLHDAEEALQRYRAGSEHPCWYDDADPDRHSVLVSRDMDTRTQSMVLCVSLALGVIGVSLVKFGARMNAPAPNAQQQPG